MSGNREYGFAYELLKQAMGPCDNQLARSLDKQFVEKNGSNIKKNRLENSNHLKIVVNIEMILINILKINLRE